MPAQQYKKTPVHRRRFLVHSFQYRLMFGNLVYLCASVLLFVVVIFGPVMLELGDPNLSQAAREDAARQMLVLHERVWLALPLFIALCVGHSILISHRIAGPLYRFQRIFRDLGKGNLTMEIRLRGKDYLHTEAEAINDTIADLGERIRGVQESYGRTGTTLAELMSALGREDRTEAKIMAGKLGTQLDALGQRVQAFQIPTAEDDEPRSSAERPNPIITTS